MRPLISARAWSRDTPSFNRPSAIIHWTAPFSTPSAPSAATSGRQTSASGG